MSENKEESNSVEPDIKPEESSPKEETKAVDKSSKDSEKDSAKEESIKEESDKESIKNESESEEEEGMGLLDRPVEVTGCRARKKVERLTVSFTTKEKVLEIPEGKGQKLGDCPIIEHQIQKTNVQELKALHRILFGRLGSVNEIKKNIRKFTGFPFAKDSTDFDKKKAVLDKLAIAALKQFCATLDLERGGNKDDIVARLMNFLMCPKDSGKVPSKKKSSSKGRKKSTDKKTDKSKLKNEKSEEEVDSANESASEEASDKDDEESEEEDVKKKSKNSKPKKATKTPAKKPEKKGKPKKDAKKETAKGNKRKRDDIPDDSDESSDDEPIAKKSKMPSDDEIKKLVKRILDAADLQEITMKKVIKQVADAYPDCDLSHKKAFIKTTIKSVIS